MTTPCPRLASSFANVTSWRSAPPIFNCRARNRIFTGGPRVLVLRFYLELGEVNHREVCLVRNAGLFLLNGNPQQNQARRVVAAWVPSYSQECIPQPIEIIQVTERHHP